MVLIAEKKPDFELELKHSQDVFLKARDYYHSTHRFCDNIAVRNEKEEIIYYLYYEKNQVNELDYVSDFWNYDITSKYIDFELVERGEVFIFLTLEEYTYTCIHTIQKFFPQKYIIIKDKNAEIFFEESEHVIFIKEIKDIFNRHKNLVSKVIFTIDSAKEYLSNPMRFIIKRYRSLEFMNGLYWMSDMHTFGERNPEKIFYVIHNPLDSGGLSDMIKFTLYRAIMAYNKGFIPIVDLSVKGDNNQFNNGNGDNAWLMFFRQLCDVTLEEVYSSKNVIISENCLDIFNPYIQEYELLVDECYLFDKFLKLNNSAEKFVEEKFHSIIPENSKVLGVIGRGTDFRSTKARWVPEPMQPEKLIEVVEQYISSNTIDYIFLATEDKIVFEEFMNSSLKDKILYLEQNRMDYSEDKKMYYLSELYHKDNTFDGYKFNLNYLAVLYILSKCHSLISGCMCGACRVALALNNNQYEDAIVY